jgi:hypothetical protein
MTATTYRTRDVVDQLAEPCERRREAQRLFVRYGQLPCRTPGLTFADAAHWSPFGWFDAAARRIASRTSEPTP